MDKILRDPNTNTSMTVAFGTWVFGLILVISAFSLNYPFLIAGVYVMVWIQFIVALATAIGYAAQGTEPLKNQTLPFRLIDGWLPISGAISVYCMWYFSGFVWLACLWFFAKAVLSMNYDTIRDIHDKRYTKSLQRSQRGNDDNVWRT